MDTDIITMDDEWGGLSFWPTSLEEATARRWPVLLIAPLVIEMALAWWINGKTGTRWRYDLGAFELDPVLISLVCALALSAVCFRNWMTSVRRLFPSLYNQGSLGGPTDATYARFRRSAETYQDWLHHPIRYALIGLVLLFTSVAMVRFDALSVAVEVHFGAARPTAADWAFTVLSFGFVAMMLLWSYAVGAAAWCLIVTGVYVNKLPATFSMRIKLGHPDKCGGLRGLGSCCLGIATPLLIGVGLLGLWIVLAGTATTFKSTAELALVVVIPIAIVAFLAPLWSIHTFMSCQREALVGELGRDLDAALRRIKDGSATASDADLKSFSDRATALKQLDPDIAGMREWPFDTQLLIKFAATPVASGVGAILKNIHW